MSPLKTPAMSEKQVKKLTREIKSTLKIQGVKLPANDLERLTRSIISHCKLSWYDGMLALLHEQNQRDLKS